MLRAPMNYTRDLEVYKVSQKFREDVAVISSKDVAVFRLLG